MKRKAVVSIILTVFLIGNLAVAAACSAGAPADQADESSVEESAEASETQPEPIDLSDAIVESIPNAYYSGGEQFISPVVTYDGDVLVEGVDYWMDHYSNNINVGTATADIVGNGVTVLGQIPISFNIVTGDDICDSEENSGLVAFVDRLYVHMMGRYPTLSELTDNVRRLRSGSRSGIELINVIVQSPEYSARELSDEEFLSSFYLGVLNRNIDDQGMAYNLGLLNGGMTRLELINGIICAEEGEFANLCSSLGVNLGNGSVVGQTPTLDDGVPSSVFNYSVDGRNISVHRRIYQFIHVNDDGVSVFDMDAMCAASQLYPAEHSGGFKYTSGVYELVLENGAMTLTIGGDEIAYYEDTIGDGEELFRVNDTDTTVTIGMIVMIEYNLESLSA
ncbi:MAG: DUF4214 domain-containing protein [Clostridiales bacterium]|nr:DUF4214 domain-containing protein [Clostridiales bacterium]